MIDEEKTAVLITYDIIPGQEIERGILTKNWTSIEDLMNIIRDPMLSPGVERFVMAVSRIDDDGRRYVVNCYSDCDDPGLKALAHDLFEQTPLEVSDTNHAASGVKH